MFIRDFHSKLISGKEEGRLFEALRKLRNVESLKALAAQQPATWSVWTDGSDVYPAPAKA